MPTPNRNYTTVTEASEVLDGINTPLGEIDRDVHAIVASSFSVFRAAAFSIPSGVGTYTQVVFDREEWDQAAAYDPATGRFTPTVAGYYRLTALVIPSGSGILSAGELWSVALFKNGVIAKSLLTAVAATGGTPSAYLPGSVLVQANGTTDYFDVRATHTHASSADGAVGANGCFFQGERVGLA